MKTNMANAVRAKNDFPDTVYFDDWFVDVDISEMVGKTVYLQTEYMHCYPGMRKALNNLGVIIMSKKDFDAAACDYIAVFSGWTKCRKNGMDKIQKSAMSQWKKTGSPLRLMMDHIEKGLNEKGLL